ncbi:hypothetical protein [Desulfobacter sp.]|uniref:hypothetical protein n=1 Tax=Desulfobacter sp. TaxID=2294 RepID=UPI003D0F18B4
MSNNRFLKNPKTGQILHWNPSLAKRSDLSACPPPWETDKRLEDDPVQLPGTGGDMQLAATDTPPDEQALAAKKEKGEALIKEWFGRDVSKVSKEDLRDFAMKKELSDPTGTKLEMVFQIAHGLNQGE